MEADRSYNPSTERRTLQMKEQKNVAFLTSVIQHRYSPYRRPGPLTNPQGKPDKGKAPAHHLVEIGQVLKWRDPVRAAHHMARVRATDRIIRAG